MGPMNDHKMRISLSKNKVILLAVGSLLGASLTLLFNVVLPDDSKPIILSQRCFFDDVQGMVRDDLGFSGESTNSGLRVQGWFVDSAASLPARNVKISIVDSKNQVVDNLSGISISRKDVADVLGDSALELSGFDVIGRKAITPGTYTIHLSGEFGSILEICRVTPQLLIK